MVVVVVWGGGGNRKRGKDREREWCKDGTRIVDGKRYYEKEKSERRGR